MATRHRVRTRAPVEVAFDCASCGFAARAVVEGEGLGTATSYVVLDREHARTAAGEEAVAEAKHDAQIIASIAPCPRCTKRSRTAVASFVARSVLEAIGFLVLGSVLWWLTDAWPRWIALLSMLAAATVSAQRRRTRYFLASALLQDIRPRAVLPRAEVRALLPAPAPRPAATPEAVEPTPATDEPRRLR